MEPLRGVYTIALTPFTENGEIDEAGIRSLTEFYIESGVNGITILGIMGEVSRLSEDERYRVMKAYIDSTQGKIPVIVGCSAHGTDVSIQLAQKAEAYGAAGIMVAPPNQVKSLELVFGHFRRVAEAVSIPVVVQDEPVNTGVNMPAPFISRIINEIPNCRYIKLEEAPTTIKITDLLKGITADVDIFGGLFGMYFYEELDRGASGIMTGFAYPEILVETYRRFQISKPDARHYFYKYLPLIRFEAQLGVGGVGIRKEIFKLRGLISSSHVRFPAPKIDRQTVREIEDLIHYLGLKL